MVHATAFWLWRPKKPKQNEDHAKDKEKNPLAFHINSRLRYQKLAEAQHVFQLNFHEHRVTVISESAD
jgi:hypothetical protein